jgi:succinate dehydrogenase/fumarate reductase flavoprotein subunit
MWENAGPFRTAEKLAATLDRIRAMKADLPDLSISDEQYFNLDFQDWFELRAMLATAEAVVTAALARTESRGAHQRLDFPASDETLVKNQVLALKDGRLAASWVPVARARAAVVGP